jgi:predicted metal-binding membrane protein
MPTIESASDWLSGVLLAAAGAFQFTVQERLPD